MKWKTDIPLKQFYLVLLLSFPVMMRADVPVDRSAKTHQLFVGTDMKVQWQGDYSLVTRFKGSHVVVRDERARPVELDKVEDFRWERRPKVSRAPLTITNLDHTRMYSVNRDPATKWNDTQLQLGAYQSTRQDVAVGEHMMVLSGQGPNQATMKKLYGVTPGRLSAMQVPGHGQYSDDLYNGRITLEQVRDASTESMTDTFDQGLNAPTGEFFRDRIHDESNAGDYDSFELQFEIASREPIADAHAMIFATLVTPQNPDGSTVIVHQRVGKLDTEPRRITVRKAGLVGGFELKDVRVQIYAQGCELGSNLSERSRPISADEARGFLLLAHLSDHRNETVAPQPVWELAPTELWAATDERSFDYPVIVSLNAHGQILGIHQNAEEARESLAVMNVEDFNTKFTPLGLGDLVPAKPPQTSTVLGQTGQLPDQVVATLRRVVFMPALDQGVPVPSFTTVNLADFFR